MESGFLRTVRAMYEIQQKRLYRASHGTFAEYFRVRWSFSRAHSYRLTEAGRLLEAMKSAPQNATLSKFTSQAHFRPLARLDSDEARIQAIDLIGSWSRWNPAGEISPSLVDSAVTVANPVIKTPVTVKSEKEILVAKVKVLVGDMRAGLPPKTPRAVLKMIDNLGTKIGKLARHSKTGISWTETTWNPLQGCSWASEGCSHCYAAKLVATRLKGRFPGLANAKVKKDDNGDPHIGYFFSGKITLLPEALEEPLRDLQPKTYFVNSMSDLFHQKVPIDFIEAVFGVMEKASWHVFQVLTKRPGRMADFTEAYFADREPPANIWLGTSTENQEAFDKRIPDILRVKTAVRWLSCEPLIGPIKLKLNNIHWVVVGGESGSSRRMDKAWATAIRDQCERSKAPFFFKQWGAFDESGKKQSPRKKAGKSETLDGSLKEAYPPQLEKVRALVWNPPPKLPPPTNVIRFTAVKLPNGWLGNMAAYPIEHNGIKYLTTEALFQCLRFEGNPEVQKRIRESKSPMGAKMASKPLRAAITRRLCDADDLDRMLLCLMLKIQQHPVLKEKLIATGELEIIEDCSARAADVEIDGVRYGKDGFPFWGASWDGRSWKGQNELGKLWMRLRTELKSQS